MNQNHYTSFELSKMLKEEGAPQVSEKYWVKNKRGEIKLVDKTKTGGGVSTHWYEVICSAFLVSEIGERLNVDFGDARLLNYYNHAVNRKTTSNLTDYMRTMWNPEIVGKMYFYLLQNKLIEGMKVC